jgi:hypothetical protein
VRGRTLLLFQHHLVEKPCRQDIDQTISCRIIQGTLDNLYERFFKVKGHGCSITWQKNLVGRIETKTAGLYMITIMRGRTLLFLCPCIK